MRSTPTSLWKSIFQLKWKSISWFWNREAVKSFSSYFSLGPTIVLAVDFCFWGKFSAHTSMCRGGGLTFCQRFSSTLLAHGSLPLFSFYTVVTVIWKYCLHDTCIEFLLVYHATFMLGRYFTLIVDVFPLLSSLMRFCLSWQIASSLLLNIQDWHGYLWMRWTYMLGILVSLGSSLNWELVYWFYNKVIIAVGHTTFIFPP